LYVCMYIGIFGRNCLLHCQLNAFATGITGNHSHVDHKKMGGHIVFLAFNVSSSIALEGARAVMWCLPSVPYCRPVRTYGTVLSLLNCTVATLLRVAIDLDCCRLSFVVIPCLIHTQ
jgi:hypothetical protein